MNGKYLLEMSNNHIESLLELGLADTTPHPLNLTVERAEGVWIYTENSHKLFDAISGIGVSNFGHSNPVITSALHAQIDKNLHTMVYGEVVHQTTKDAALLLTSLLPSPLDTVYFVNSGAEAIEGAIKLAKRSTGRNKIIACKRGYHGNTTGALSLSSNEERKAPFLPLLPEVSFIEFNDLDSLDLIDQTTSCVVTETIQGDAGVRIPTNEWMMALREKCTETGTLLILDEVQCGIGRSGTPFAFSQFNIAPDILCLGKALGGGVPIGAFVSSKEIMSDLSHSPKLGHITTFGGNPLACAGAVAALTLLKEVSWERVEKIGKLWEDGLSRIPAVKAIRRRGLFFAVELDNAEAVNKAVSNGLENGVLLFWFLSVPNAFRLSPPLSMTIEEAELGLSLIEKSLSL
jgi:acetylornithine/succinyldiaminopimelate/putrescine aminotransferase